jgi:hypothetical protein
MDNYVMQCTAPACMEDPPSAHSRASGVQYRYQLFRQIAASIHRQQTRIPHTCRAVLPGGCTIFVACSMALQECADRLESHYACSEATEWGELVRVRALRAFADALGA